MATVISSNVTDQNEVPVSGALVYVYDSSGTLASLADDNGAPRDNPVTTDADGYWEAYVADEGYYTLDYIWGGRKRRIDANVIAGRSPIDQVRAFAASAEAAAGPNYPNTASGLAVTDDGQAFAVDNGDGTVTVYLNDEGVAVAQRTLATTAALASNAPDLGASMIGFEGGSTVQDLASPDGGKGAALIAFEGGGTLQDLTSGDEDKGATKVGLAIAGLGANVQQAIQYVTPYMVGCAGDGVLFTDGAITGGDATFTSASATFTDDDIGKTIAIAGAGVEGQAHSSVIVSRNSATSVELAETASLTVSDTYGCYGTDDGRPSDARLCYDFNTTAGSAVITSATANFTSGDVGKRVWILGAGLIGPLYATISSVSNATTATLGTSATNEVSGARGWVGTDGLNPLRRMFLLANTLGGLHVVIPPGIFCSSLPLDAPGNTTVFCAGTLSFTEFFSAGGCILFKNSSSGLRWYGGRIRVNGVGNMNGLAIGDVPTTVSFVEDVHVHGLTIYDTKIDYAYEIAEGTLMAGGGKGLAVQFRARNCSFQVQTVNCEIGVGVEAAVSDDRWLENVVIHAQIRDSARTPVYVAGSLGGSLVASSLASASFNHKKLPGVTIRGEIWGGNTASIISPADGSTVIANQDAVGVLTFNYAVGITIDMVVNSSAPVTIMRGQLNAAKITLRNSFFNEVKDFWNADTLVTLTNAINAFQPDNALDLEIHTAAHSGSWLSWSQITSGGTQNPVVKSDFKIKAWGTIQSTIVNSSTTTVLGVSCAYDFASYPGAGGVRRITGHSVVKSSGLSLPATGILNYFVPAADLVAATTAQLASLTSTVNTVGKYAGKEVYNTTTSKPVWAVGATAAAVWNDATGTLAHTPV